jgi:hypothetical protein
MGRKALGIGALIAGAALAVFGTYELLESRCDDCIAEIIEGDIDDEESDVISEEDAKAIEA